METDKLTLTLDVGLGPPAFRRRLVCDGGHTRLLRVRIMLEVERWVMQAEVMDMSIRRKWKQGKPPGG